MGRRLARVARVCTLVSGRRRSDRAGISTGPGVPRCDDPLSLGAYLSARPPMPHAWRSRIWVTTCSRRTTAFERAATRGSRTLAAIRIARMIVPTKGVAFGRIASATRQDATAEGAQLLGCILMPSDGMVLFLSQAPLSGPSRTRAGCPRCHLIESSSRSRSGSITSRVERGGRAEELAGSNLSERVEEKLFRRGRRVPDPRLLTSADGTVIADQRLSASGTQVPANGVGWPVSHSSPAAKWRRFRRSG